MDESSIPDDVKRELNKKLETVMRLAGGGDRLAEIEQLTIEPYRHLSQRLPLRIYIYDLEDEMGRMEFDRARQVNRPLGSVIETGTHSHYERQYGFYLYSLQPMPDLVQRYRRDIGAADDEVRVRTIPLDGSPEDMAQALIDDSLPKTFLNEVDVSTVKGASRLLACLMLRREEAAIEPDELTEFVRRNEAAIRAGALAPIYEMAGLLEEKGPEELQSIAFMIGYLRENVDHILAGELDLIDLKSDRLLWFVYALASCVDSRRLTYQEAVHKLSAPEYQARMSPRSLLFMLKDFVDTVGGTSQPVTEYLMLVCECAILRRNRDVLRGGIAVLSKLMPPGDLGIVSPFLERAQTVLSPAGAPTDTDYVSEVRGRWVIERHSEADF